MALDGRLTPSQMEMLARAAEFVLAGEWPWTEDEKTEKREKGALESAAYKLRYRLNKKGA